MGRIIVHCVRHAQGYHNLNAANHSLPDPSLTSLGEQQCAELAKSFPAQYRERITHLVASPLRRTLYTCLLSFPAAVSRGSKVIALPELQESSDLPCDTGSSPSKLEAEFGQGEFAGCVDLSRVTEGWNSNTGRWSPASSALEKRAREARLFLRDLGQQRLTPDAAGADADQEIVVVTHGGYLHYLTEDWDGADRFVGTGWRNTEFRSYEFVSATDELASLTETRESRARRRGREIPLTETEQRELRSAREREWLASGFQEENVRL